MTDIPDIADLIEKEWDAVVPKPAKELAAGIAAPFGDAVDGVFFYGSCLRGDTEQVLNGVYDFYLVVDSYKNAYKKAGKKGWLAIANRICPPNVFYFEKEIDSHCYRAKYAVIAREDFIGRCGPRHLNTSVWARFCQPSILLLARNHTVEVLLARACQKALFTALHSVLPLYPYVPSSKEVWTEVFSRTYVAELRSEQKQKALEIYNANQKRYDTISNYIYRFLDLKKSKLLEHQPSRWPLRKAEIHWTLRRMNGKIVSFIRLLKASATFDGGIEYLAWKIRRHSGVHVDIKPWMKRNPLIAGLVLFWQTKRRGAFK